MPGVLDTSGRLLGGCCMGILRIHISDLGTCSCGCAGHFVEVALSPYTGESQAESQKDNMVLYKHSCWKLVSDVLGTEVGR